MRIEVERFDANGAHAYLMVRMRSDKPRELSLSVHHHPGSAPIEELTLDATMGNYERLRHLWLKNRILDSRDLYRGYSGNGFAQREEYPIEEILKTAGGDAIALLTTDEHDPASVEVRHGNWQYRSVKLTQYWRVPAKHMQPDLRVFVNGRRVYWNSEFEVPGGIAFESFQIRQRYVPGQEFIFGLTPEAPWEIRPALPRLGRLPERWRP